MQAMDTSTTFTAFGPGAPGFATQTGAVRPAAPIGTSSAIGTARMPHAAITAAVMPQQMSLIKRQTLALPARALHLQVDGGRAWITLDGDPTDYFVAAGESWSHPGSADAEARIVIEGDHAEPTRLRLWHLPEATTPQD